MDFYKERREDFEKNGPSQRHYVWGEIIHIHDIPGIGESLREGERHCKIVVGDGSKLEGSIIYHPYVVKDGKWRDTSMCSVSMEGAILIAIAFSKGDVKAAEYACKILNVPFQ